MCRFPTFVRFVLLLAFVAFLCLACAPAVPVSPEQLGPGKQVGRFILYDNGTALDTQTQLMWMTRDYRNIIGKPPPNYEEARNWDGRMNWRRYGGYRDWRMPTTLEYQTIYDPHLPRRSYKATPVGYPAAFEDGGGEWCWTRDIIEVETYHVHYAWAFHFVRGQATSEWAYPVQHHSGLAPTGSVRLVRGPVASASGVR